MTCDTFQFTQTYFHPQTHNNQVPKRGTEHYSLFKIWNVTEVAMRGLRTMWVANKHAIIDESMIKNKKGKCTVLMQYTRHDSKE